MGRPRNRFFPASPLQVFAVETDAVQLSWGNLTASHITVSAGPTTASVDHPGGPGCLEIQGLEPATSYVVHIEVRRSGGIDQFELATTTLPQPEGRLLSKFATVSDLHIGARSFGALSTMTDIELGKEPFAYRCARSAIADAIDWGADLLIIKGDAVHAQSNANMDELGRLLDEFSDLPMMLLPGNHDVDQRGDLTDLPESIGKRRLSYVENVATHELPGIRVVGANTTIVGKGVGTLQEVNDKILDAVSPDAPCVVALHQQLQRHTRNRYWPPGIPYHESQHFLDQLADIRSDSFVTSGHTHRNRIRMHNQVTISEVASTRDWPGVWGGYTVYENGITQTVRRISSPSALRWHEYSRQAVGGLWSLWSPGKLADRCVSRQWQD